MTLKKPLHIRILKELFRAGGTLDSFTLFKRTKVSLREFTSSILSLTQEKFIIEEEDSIKLTVEAKTFLQKKSLISYAGEKVWREVPSDMKCNSIETEKPYIPRISLLNESLK